MDPSRESAILAITRPKDSLWTYYILSALGSLIAAPIMLVYLYFRFHTMQYRFDHEGISMRWGILFHHEIVLNYARIQDIHLRSNVVERWLGLARIEIQTASGGSGAEMTIEGLDNAEDVRDFLYSRMRGAAERSNRKPLVAANGGAAEILSEAASELRAIRKLIEEGGTR
jgi:putative membrane protein